MFGGDDMRIAIVDDNISYLKIMREYLSHIREFEVIGTAENGFDACRMIQSEEPDIVLMDIAMPRLGGLGVLEKLHSQPMIKRPQFIIVTALGQEKVSRIAVELGADFFMIKPVDLDELVLNIRHLYSLKNFREIRNTIHSDCKDEERERRIRDIIDTIGVPAHLKGYDYTVYAMSIILDDLTAINAMHKQVYSTIASKFNTTPARVERVIRNAVELTWTRGRIDILNRMFGFDESSHKTKPSNSEFFIKLVAEFMAKNDMKKRSS
jgi:two-component system, response regulator, stage 0 sporulation protein A